MDEKLNYFIDQTNKRLDAIEGKLDQLISFRVMLIGASITVSGLISIGIGVLEIWVLHK